ncbi:ribonuclease J [Lyticum sinuosum]|uniref:ribonuclease J n=1 Tax=Lyticum sinuosum TaxID=1332059 RepID=UPI003899457D
MPILNLEQHYNDLLFIPLGGANEIGLNFNLYHYQGKWLIVDLGIGFSEQDLPGVDVILPKIDFIEEHKDNIIGMVLTHAHEDHLGGVQYLWHYLRCPVYTTKFTAEVLRAKLSEYEDGIDINIIEVPMKGKIELKPFSIEMINITHSIPEMNGLMIRTPKGNIFHTGDWKFDPQPIIGDITDENYIRKLGEEGILAVVCDSTNIFTEGSSKSEGELINSIGDIVSKIKNGIVIVSTFASNIARLHTIGIAAKRNNRKVFLAGRALWRVYNAARSSGYLLDLDLFLPSYEIKNYKRNEILVICTGCQGENLAAVSKIARNQHQDINLKKGDAIVFSSKIIPGNEKRISNLLNHFCKEGIETLTERDHFVHVSGHPAREEVRRMYDLLRPKISIPVHGEPTMIHEHCKFAIECGIEKAIEVSNGKVVNLSIEDPKVIAYVDSGYLAIDGNDIINDNSIIFKERQEIRDNGAVVIVLIINKSHRLIRRPKVISMGLFDRNDDSDNNIIDEIVEEIKNTISELKRIDVKILPKKINRNVQKICSMKRGKSPRVFVHIENIS